MLYWTSQAEEGLLSRRFSQIVADLDCLRKICIDAEYLQLLGAFSVCKGFFSQHHRRSILPC